MSLAAESVGFWEGTVPMVVEQGWYTAIEDPLGAVEVVGPLSGAR